MEVGLLSTVRSVSLRDAITPFVAGLRRYARALVMEPDACIAEDLVQQTVARALKDERLRRGGNVRLILYSTLTSLNRSRVRGASPARPPSTAAPFVAHSPETVSLSRIERSLLALPSDLREVVLLAALERMTYEEMADVIEVPTATMLARLSRARDELRVHFNGTIAQLSAARRPSQPRASGHLRLVK